MVKRVLFLVLIVVISCKKSSELNDPNRFVISISLKNVPDGTLLYLRKQEDKLSIDLDSTRIQNGRASFEGSISSPEVFGIFIDGITRGIFPIVEKGQILVQGNPKGVEPAQISGTELNDQLAQYKNRVAEILSKTNNYYHDFQKARAENDLKRLNAINEQIKEIQGEKVNYGVQFIKENPDSFVSSMVLHSLTINKELPTEELSALLDQLSETVKKTEFSKAILVELQLDSIQQSLNTP